MNLLIIGAPGAGKGTMSDLIVQNFNIVHISTGDMLREAIRNETPVGVEAQGFMNRGQLVPDRIIHDIITERLSKHDVDNGFLFDGYPRNKEQAVDLDGILNWLGKKIDMVINLNIEDEALVKRITGRRLCPECGAIYNTFYSPSAVEGKCDKCGADLIQRKDDNLESMVVRLDAYHKATEPIIAYYEKKGLVKNFEANKPVSEVFADIKDAIEKAK